MKADLAPRKDEDEDEDYDVFWKPVRHLRPAKPRGLRAAPEPVPQVLPEPVKGKGRARSGALSRAFTWRDRALNSFG